VKVPVSWLLEHLEIDADPEMLARLLTMGGLEVEATTEFAGRSGYETLVFETYVTPNRGDCLSVRGVAREAAALLPCPLKPMSEPPVVAAAGPARFAVEIEAPDLCPRYVGVLVQGVTVGPSPDWLANAVEAAGARPINNVVDVTNYVLMDIGQPLHAFDFDELIGAQIIVRRAAPGERITLIDHTEKTLDGDELVIADVSSAVALAGVMGGLRSEIGAATESILIESAHFSPGNIRRTSRKLGVASESSFRFERTVDPGGCERAALRAAQLLVEVAGGEIVGPAVDAVAPSASIGPLEIRLRPERVNALLGTDLPAEAIADALVRLQLGVRSDGAALAVLVPTFRPDLKMEADLAEEVARIVGYDAIPERLPVTAATVGGRTPDRARADELCDALLRCGLIELRTQSIVDPSDLDRLGLPDDDPRRACLALDNALSADLSTMRTQLLAPLLMVVAHNRRHRVPGLAAFEIGPVYRPAPDARPEEPRSLGVVMYGCNLTSAWNVDPRLASSDFFTLKGCLTAALERMTDRPVVFEQAAEAPFDPACCAVVKLGGERIGVAGRAGPQVADEFGVPIETYLAEVAVEDLLRGPRPRRVYSSLPRFPEVLRDLALLVDRGVACEVVADCIRHAGGPELRSVDLFDVYEGKGIEPGQRSLAFSLAFRHDARTLTNEEVDEAVAGILRALEAELGATLRS